MLNFLFDLYKRVEIKKTIFILSFYVLLYTNPQLYVNTSY